MNTSNGGQQQCLEKDSQGLAQGALRHILKWLSVGANHHDHDVGGRVDEGGCSDDCNVIIINNISSFGLENDRRPAKGKKGGGG
jgi:hypothetical protein